MDKNNPLRQPVNKAAAALFAVGMLVAQASSAAEPWVSIANQALPLQNATLLGATAPGQTVDIVVGLKLRNVAQLQSFITHVNTPGDPLYGQFLTPAQFTSMFSAASSQTLAVVNYLHAAGFSNVTVAPNRQLITASAPASVAAAAFNTSLFNYNVDGKTIYAYSQPPMVPASLGPAVVSVQGLTNLPLKHIGRQTQVGPPDPGSVAAELGPHDFEKVYGAAGFPGAQNTTVGVFAAGPMDPVLKDIAKFKKKYAVPDYPVTVVPVGAGPGTDSSGQTEFDMDTQTSTGLAGGVKELIIYDMGSLNDSTIAFNRFVTDNLAKTASASFGGCEALNLFGGALYIEDQIFMQSAAQGQTIFVSTGDSGSACTASGLTNGVPTGVEGQVEYPASSPWVVGAGGTTVFRNADGTLDFEITWDAGGGGVSEFEEAPAWQLPVLPLGAAQSGSGKLRGVPDVAMDADFVLSPGAFFSNGSPTSNGGTSLAAPLSMGAWARILSAHDNQLGHAGPALYALATGLASPAAGFNDVVAGSNGMYTATPGYDYTTGLGSFNIAAISGVVKDVPTGITVSPATGAAMGDACAMPGVQIVKDPAGDTLYDEAVPGASVPGHDLRAVYVAEPYAANALVNAGDDKLVITMEVDDLSNPPPNTLYVVYFGLPDGLTHVIGYDTTPAPADISNPGFTVIPTNFFYAHMANDATGSFINPVYDGELDAQSTVDAANNRIIFVISKSKIPALASKTVLSGAYGGISINDGIFGAGDTESTDISTPADYAEVGNLSCKGKSSGGLAAGTDPVPGAGALGIAFLLPLAALGALRRSRRIS